MAITNLEVCKRFVKGLNAHNLNMKSDTYVGCRKLISYATPIAETEIDGQIWVCEDKFSISTSRQQSELRHALRESGYVATEERRIKNNRSTYRGPNELSFVLYRKR